MLLYFHIDHSRAQFGAQSNLSEFYDHIHVHTAGTGRSQTHYDVVFHQSVNACDRFPPLPVFPRQDTVPMISESTLNDLDTSLPNQNT